MINEAKTPPEGDNFEENLESEARNRAYQIAKENRMPQLYGPPEKRDKRNQRYVAALVRMYTKLVIRGILVALSVGGKDSTSYCLQHDDLTLPLDQIINRHFGCGPCLRVWAADAPPLYGDH